MEKELLTKRGTYKSTTPCLFIHMAVLLLWTELFKLSETNDDDEHYYDELITYSAAAYICETLKQP